MKRIALLFGVLLLVTALSGCIVTGDFHRASMFVPEQRGTQSVLDNTSQKIADVLNGISRNLRCFPSKRTAPEQMALSDGKEKMIPKRDSMKRSMTGQTHTAVSRFCPLHRKIDNFGLGMI